MYTYTDHCLLFLLLLGDGSVMRRYLVKSTILKLVSAIFYQIFIFTPNCSPLKTMNNIFLFHLKSSFRSRDIQIFVIFPLPFHTFQIQKDKWKWNNL